MIGLSLLSSGHPKIFQHQLVRPSAPRYRGFGLPKDRSPGFGSAAAHSTRHSHSLSLRLRHIRLNLARPRRLAGSLCKRHAVTPKGGSHSPGAHDFRVSFTPLEGVLFTFPSRYSFAIGRQMVFSLVGWAPRIRTGFHVSRPTWDPAGWLGASRMGLSPAAARLSRRSRPRLAITFAVPQPRRMNPPVWASSAFARRYLRNLC